VRTFRDAPNLAALVCGGSEGSTVKRIIRPKEAQARLGIGHTKFYADVKAGVLPPLVRLGPRSVGHVEDELDAYIESLKAERDCQPERA
jgi:predicted DNA-binding transcriptional regulator AlpA